MGICKSQNIWIKLLIKCNIICTIKNLEICNFRINIKFHIHNTIEYYVI